MPGPLQTCQESRCELEKFYKRGSTELRNREELRYVRVNFEIDTILIINGTYKVLDTVLGAVADEDTKSRVLSLLIDPEMDKMKCEVDVKVAAILDSHLVGHPIMYYNKITEIVQDIKQEKREKERERKRADQ